MLCVCVFKRVYGGCVIVPRYCNPPPYKYKYVLVKFIVALIKQFLAVIVVFGNMPSVECYGIINILFRNINYCNDIIAMSVEKCHQGFEKNTNSEI